MATQWNSWNPVCLQVSLHHAMRFVSCQASTASQTEARREAEHYILLSKRWGGSSGMASAMSQLRWH